MTTLAQHLAAHQATSKWVDCDGGCGWWAKHTGHPMPACTCGQVSRSDDPTAEHAAHVAATWQQARTITTIDHLDALPEGALLGLMDEGNLIDVVDEWDHDDREEMVSHWEVIVLWRPKDGDQ